MPDRLVRVQRLRSMTLRTISRETIDQKLSSDAAKLARDYDQLAQELEASAKAEGVERLPTT